MKAMKAMKAMKRVSVIAKNKRAKSTVFHGHKTKTVGGLTKSDLFKNKRGKIVSKKASLGAKRRFAKTLGEWEERTGPGLVREGEVFLLEVSQGRMTDADLR